jgi:hypothetical protein
MDKNVLERIAVPQVENHYNLTSTSQQYPPPQHGGRVPNINDPSTFQFAARPYKLYSDGRPVFEDNPRSDLVGHLHKETPLNAVFFSNHNIDSLQTQIHDQVMAMSGGKYDIGRQSDDDLRLIMRSYYLMFGRNDPTRVASELEELNRRVIGYCSGKIYSEVDFHMFYRKDLEEFAPAIANPVNTQVFGTRTGELKSFF